MLSSAVMTCVSSVQQCVIVPLPKEYRYNGDTESINKSSAGNAGQVQWTLGPTLPLTLEEKKKKMADILFEQI